MPLMLESGLLGVDRDPDAYCDASSFGRLAQRSRGDSLPHHVSLHSAIQAQTFRRLCVVASLLTHLVAMNPA